MAMTSSMCQSIQRQHSPGGATSPFQHLRPNNLQCQDWMAQSCIDFQFIPKMSKTVSRWLLPWRGKSRQMLRWEHGNSHHGNSHVKISEWQNVSWFNWFTSCWSRITLTDCIKRHTAASAARHRTLDVITVTHTYITAINITASHLVVLISRCSKG